MEVGGWGRGPGWFKGNEAHLEAVNGLTISFFPELTVRMRVPFPWLKHSPLSAVSPQTHNLTAAATLTALTTLSTP